MSGDHRAGEIQSQMPSPMRVGVVVSSLSQPLWVAEVVRRLSESKYARLVFVAIVDKSPAPINSSPRNLRLKGCLYSLYVRLDNRFAARPADLLEHQDIRLSIPQDQHLDVFQLGRDSPSSSGASGELDVLLNLTGDDLPDATNLTARYGVWTYTSDSPIGGVAGAWEAICGLPITSAGLEVEGEGKTRRIIFEIHTATDRWSVRRNANRVYAPVPRLLDAIIGRLCRFGEDCLLDGTARETPQRSNLHQGNGLSNRQMLGAFVNFLYDFATYKAGRLLQRGKRKQWFISYRLTGAQNTPVDGFDEFTPLYPPQDRFWADPFVAEFRGKHYLFFEELVYDVGKGRICVLEIDHNGNPTQPKVVLEEPYHLSYPFVFEWEGHHYMIPESSQAGEVQLYQASEFPYRWDRVSSLITTKPALDATLFEHDDLWWMFLVGADYELLVYYAEAPLGPWQPHKRNPVKCDIRSCRPAGRPFHRDGKLLRPAQDCSIRYGYSVVLNEIVTLTTQDFEERVVRNIPPTWQTDLIATHTLDHVAGLTVIDGQRWITNPAR